MGFFGRIKARFTFGLFALCPFVVVFAVPASAQEEYQITAILQAPELEEGAGFGGSVAVSGDIVAVGASGAYVEGKRAGRVYIFDPEGNLLVTLQAPEPVLGGFFGHSVAVSGDVVAVNELWADVEDKIQAGRAYLFDSSGNLLATLQSPTPQTNAQFGGSHEYPTTREEEEERPACIDLRLLAVSGDIVVIGERGADVEGVIDAGRAYIISPTPTPTPTPKPTTDYTPYLMAAAVIVVIVVASAVYVMRRKRQ